MPQSHSWAYTQRKTWSERMHAPQLHWSAVNNSQDMEATWMSTDRGMYKYVVHIFSGILCDHLKKVNNAICSNMDAELSYWVK